MLSKIFLLKRKNTLDLNTLDIYSYPEDIDKKDNKEIVLKIIQGHDHGSLEDNCCEKIISKSKANSTQNTSNPFVIGNPVSQLIGNQNLYTICINIEMLIGLVFEKEDNPYDYREIFVDMSNELLNIERCCSFKDDTEIENFLITLFIDIKRFGDETLEKAPEVSFHPSGLFTKVFLFGIDEVGKSSFTRRIKTGEYNENFFTPSKRFNIEYIQREDGLLSVWDSPGQSTFREKWLLGLQDSNIIIYIIDVANQLRFDESKTEFWKIYNENDLKDIPLLILGNKIDLINHNNSNNDEQIKRTEKEIFDFFEFDSLQHNNWTFVFTSVKTSYNIEKVLNTIFTLVSA
ncbi:MAG TPA: ADP-ribosylation factor-like protein [Candidatus Nanopelagicaceae bacterium]|nr:ADP-ribosylation factor-like protein [Candidatus Nanopelagicaceae bacterium]